MSKIFCKTKEQFVSTEKMKKGMELMTVERKLKIEKVDKSGRKFGNVATERNVRQKMSGFAFCILFVYFSLNCSNK